ncbi:hypothetical protein BS47DRAFT_1370123, partial [Hydnum rufescens UP504]
LCIPTDNDRPFGFLQSGFFSESTASVPVIGIFTKLDGRETKVRSAVLDSTASPSDFLARVAEVKQKVAEFVHGLETEFQKAQYPPAGFARVGNALPPGTQRSLLELTVWKRNRRVHTIYVLERVLDSGAEGNIMTRTRGPGEDEETQLHADSSFRILMYVSLEVPPFHAWLFPDTTSGAICNQGNFWWDEHIEYVLEFNVWVLTDKYFDDIHNIV